MPPNYKSNPIYVSFTFDINYIIPFYVSVTSILHNNNRKNIIFHVIATGFNNDDLQIIKEYITQRGSNIYFHKIDEIYVREFQIPDNTYFTSSIFYRLFLPLLVPHEVGKLIYLDTDTLTVGNFSELYNINLDPFPVGAANDSQMYTREDLGIKNKNNYFNSGVLLINTAQWNAQNITGKAIEFIINNGNELKFPDQDALNVALYNNWFKFDQRFNIMKNDIPVMNNKELKEFVNNKIIIHYNDITKPWTKGFINPLKYLFDKYYNSFAESKIGIHVIQNSIQNKLTHLIITELKEEDDDIETIILIGFSLHLCWINAINKFNNKIESAEILKDYNDPLSKVDNSMIAHFKTEFESNKEILLKVYKDINYSNNLTGNNNINWVNKWKEICLIEINNLNLSSEITMNSVLNKLKNFPTFINTQLRITKAIRNLLYYFILSCNELI